MEVLNEDDTSPVSNGNCFLVESLPVYEEVVINQDAVSEESPMEQDFVSSPVSKNNCLQAESRLFINEEVPVKKERNENRTTHRQHHQGTDLLFAQLFSRSTVKLKRIKTDVVDRYLREGRVLLVSCKVCQGLCPEDDCLVTDCQDDLDHCSEGSGKLESVCGPDHRDFSSPTKSWNCKVCNDTFTSRSQWQVHIESVHPVQSNDCKVCNESFKSGYLLQEHNLSVHERKGYNGNTCRRRTNREIPSKDRSIELQKEETHLCFLCNQVFQTKYALEEHISINHGPYTCTTCKVSFRSQYLLSKHIMLFHEGNLYLCEICDDQFQSKYFLQKHVLLVHGEGHTCDVCYESFKSKYLLANHKMTLAHFEERYVCFICDKIFKSEYILRNHILSVHEGKLYSCLVCSESFESKCHLDEHRLVHIRC